VTSNAAASAPVPSRLESVDLLRGVIVVIMALDHTRDFFGAIGADPTDVTTATTALFLTRWVTHLCAPVFFLLTGTGAWFSGRRRTPAGLSHHLLIRGLWLVFLEFTVVRCLGLQFNFDYQVTILTVLWALGWSMVALAFISRLPLSAIVGLGLAMVVGHDLLDGIPAASFGAWAPFWSFVHAPGVLFASPGHLVIVAYPLIPWIGVTALGFAMGPLLERPLDERSSFLWKAGFALTASFILLRVANRYGDPRPWAYFESTGRTFLSFLNASKYPPSLVFLLMTLGPALLLLAWFQRGTPKWLRPALPYGKTPLFFFLVHFALIHTLAVVAALARFGDAAGMFQSPSLDRFPITAPPGWDLGLPFVYLVWGTVILVMYPFCRWYARIRGSGRYPLLSYL
jgi:uncharacterized membrane protein